MKKMILIALVALGVSFPAEAGIKEYWQQLKADIATTWQSKKYDAYIPAYAWHNRLTYDRKHLDKYNENPWGLGLGKHYEDDKGNWHGLYAMAFKDSNDHLEIFFGYAWLKRWNINDNPNFKVGVGYTLGLTQRSEWYYLPVPAPLPIASLEYKRLAVQAAYVPGVKNDGNVLFVWTKLSIN